MEPINTLPKPMTSFYTLFTSVVTGKGNIFGLSAITLQSTGFVFNPTLLNGLIPIITGIGLFFLSIWQKKKAEEKATELHLLEIDGIKEEQLNQAEEAKNKSKESELLLRIKEEQLEAAQLKSELLRRQLAQL